MSSALSENEYDLLVFLEQYYWTNSCLPTVEVATSQLGLSDDLYLGALKKHVFRESLIDRGIPRKTLQLMLPADMGEAEDVPGWKRFALSEMQLLTANAILDSTDNRSRRKKLVELGVSTQDYERWMRDPVFSGYLRQRAESLLNDSAHESHLALVERVRSGDVNAIKYFNELTGRYVPVSARGNVTSALDVKMILIRVVEVVQRHCEPSQIQAISAELAQLVEGGLGDTLSSGGNSNSAPVIRGVLEERPEALPAVQKRPQSEGTVIREVKAL